VPELEIQSACINGDAIEWRLGVVVNWPQGKVGGSIVVGQDGIYFTEIFLLQCCFHEEHIMFRIMLIWHEQKLINLIQIGRDGPYNFYII